MDISAAIRTVQPRRQRVHAAGDLRAVRDPIAVGVGPGGIRAVRRKLQAAGQAVGVKVGVKVIGVGGVEAADGLMVVVHPVPVGVGQIGAGAVQIFLPVGEEVAIEVPPGVVRRRVECKKIIKKLFTLCTVFFVQSVFLCVFERKEI